MRIDSLDRDANLPAVRETAGHRARYGSLKIGVRLNNQCGIAAKFQRDSLQAGRRATNRTMPLPDHRRVSDVMTHDPVTVTSETPQRIAATIMVDHSIHRVFVTEGGKLAGVLCASDLATAVRDALIPGPVSSMMSSPVVTVDVHAPLSSAIDLLDRVHITGLIVTDETVPVGMFSQTEALASRDLPRDTPIETTYDAAVMCVPAEMKIHRVAAHVADLRVRRVVVCKAREAIGIVSATDFARLVALA